MKSFPQLEGKAIAGNDWPEFTWNADLVDFEGPLVSLYKTSSDADALFIWVDAHRKSSRWCVLEVDREPLADYLTQKRTLANLFELKASVLVFNAGSTGRRSNIQEVKIVDLPELYRPKQGSFLVDEIATDEARALVEEATVRQSFLLNNELYLEDVTVIPRVVLQLYSFHYGLLYSTRDAVREKLHSIMGKWRGGINAVNIFTGLRSVIPSIHRPRVVRLAYASPGEITMDLLPSLYDEVAEAMKRVADDAQFSELQALYDSAYAYFKAEELSGFDDASAQRPIMLSAVQKKKLVEFVDKFFELMHWSSLKGGFDALDHDPLSKLRVLLAYYRRIRQLRPLLEQGKLAVPK